MANSVGHPPKFTTVDELEQLVDSYFETEDGKETPGVAGLAVHLDTTRKTLLDYENKPEYSYTIKRAKARIEAKMEKRLYGQNVTGLIFNLKNNFGWVDKTEVKQEVSGELKTGDGDPALANQFKEFLKNQSKQE